MPDPYSTPQGNLDIIPPNQPHLFAIPKKEINSEGDVQTFLRTHAYTNIMTFILQLNLSMFPRKTDQSQKVETWELNGSNVVYSETVLNLRQLLSKLEKIIEEAPPDPGPRRFGNFSFRKWHDIVNERIDHLLNEYLPKQVLEFPAAGGSEKHPAGSLAENLDEQLGLNPAEKKSERITAKDELKSYLMGSFGSAQRLDYGTGHELSFLAFLAGIWKLSGFAHSEPSMEERAIVLGVIEPYLHLIRKLILTYTLEPAGSHGVWGLDDHTFIPYIFGSAQYSPAISTPADIPNEGSLPDAPKSGDVTKKLVIERERKTNMYFSAIGFIYDVKKGPFWEHSPILFDISGVSKGWAKINKGMIKMYNAEVLSKFPVVQHFHFGSLFPWKKNPQAPAPPPSTHTTTTHRPPPSTSHPPTQAPSSQDSGTKAPWASAPRTGALPGPTTSWTGQSGAPGMPATRAPWANATGRPPPPVAGTGAGTAAPWAVGSTGMSKNYPSAPVPGNPWPKPIGKNPLDEEEGVEKQGE